MSKEKGLFYNLRENLVGRPPIFKTPEEMADKAIEYFEYCKKEKEKLTVTGLVLFLGFQDKKSLRDYKAKDGYSPLIKKILLVVENAYEKQLHAGNVAGSIFALKNMGWKDKSEMAYTKEDKTLTTEEREARIKELAEKAKNKE